MASVGFGKYRNKLFHYYEEKRYSEALAVAMEASKMFADYDAKTSFWIACLQSRLADYEDVIQTLHRATRRGVWWPTGTLQDSDLDAVRGRPEFKTIEEDCRRLQRQAPKRAKPELMVRVPSNYPDGRNWPALVVFHARYGERPEVSAEEWLSIVSTGTILAAPWSSQVYASDGRCWDDWELSELDVKWVVRASRQVDVSVDYFLQQSLTPRLNPNMRPSGFAVQNGLDVVHEGLVEHLSRRLMNVPENGVYGNNLEERGPLPPSVLIDPLPSVEGEYSLEESVHHDDIVTDDHLVA